MSANTEGLNKSSLFPVLIITALAIGLYSNSLKNGFVYDDEFTIVNNTFVRSFDNLPLLFDKTAYFSRSGEVSYRPVVTFTYFIDYALYGLNPWGYHLTNVFLHAINGALLYIFLRQAGDSPLSHSSRLTSLAFLISILFISHPVLTEAVNCISYREDLLAFLFYMTTLSLYLIVRQPTSDHRPLTTAFFYLLSCLTYLLALFSKEMAVTFPLIIFCYEWLYGKKEKLPSRLFNPYIMGYIAITLFYLYLRFYLFHNPEKQIQAWSLVERVLTMPWLIINYLKLSLFPVYLSADYVINPASSPFSPIFILPIIALVSIFAITLRLLQNSILCHSRSVSERESGFLQAKTIFPIESFGDDRQFYKRLRSILFGALFFFITLTPVYNLVPLSIPFAERYLYLPLAGFTMFAVLLTYLIAEKFKVRPEYGNRYMPIFFLVVFIIFSFSVVKRNSIWRDSYSLWSDTVVKMPNSSRAHNNLGLVYYDQGRIDEAVGEYLTAIKLRFNNAGVHNNLGLAYLRQGRYYEAIYEFKTALKLKSDYADAYNNLGNIYARQNLFDQAIKEYLTAIRLRPDDAYIHYNLGIAYFKRGRYDEAIYEFRVALKLKPDYKEAYQNLKGLMEKKKGYKDAGNATANQDKNWSP